MFCVENSMTWKLWFPLQLLFLCQTIRVVMQGQRRQNKIAHRNCCLQTWVNRCVGCSYIRTILCKLICSLGSGKMVFLVRLFFSFHAHLLYPLSTLGAQCPSSSSTNVTTAKSDPKLKNKSFNSIVLWIFSDMAAKVPTFKLLSRLAVI